MEDATKRVKLTVEPSEFHIRGFIAEDLCSKEFLAKLKAEFPTVQVFHDCLAFSDSKDLIYIGHDRKEGKIIPDYIDIGSTDSKLSARMVEVLKRVFG